MTARKPWTVTYSDGHAIVYEGDRLICTVDDADDGALIARAPALLACVRSLARILRSHRLTPSQMEKLLHAERVERTAGKRG